MKPRLVVNNDSSIAETIVKIDAGFLNDMLYNLIIDEHPSLKRYKFCDLEICGCGEIMLRFSND